MDSFEVAVMIYAIGAVVLLPLFLRNMWASVAEGKDTLSGGDWAGAVVVAALWPILVMIGAPVALVWLVGQAVKPSRVRQRQAMCRRDQTDLRVLDLIKYYGATEYIEDVIDAADAGRKTTRRRAAL